MLIVHLSLWRKNVVRSKCLMPNARQTILSYFVSKKLTLSFMKIYKSMVDATLRVLPLHPLGQRL